MEKEKPTHNVRQEKQQQQSFCCNPAHEDMPPTPKAGGVTFWSVAVPGRCQVSTTQDQKCTSGAKTNVTIHEYVTAQAAGSIIVVPTGHTDIKEVEACVGDACP